MTLLPYVIVSELVSYVPHCRSQGGLTLLLATDGCGGHCMPYLGRPDHLDHYYGNSLVLLNTPWSTPSTEDRWLPVKLSEVSTPYDLLFGRLLISFHRARILAEDLDTRLHHVVWSGDLQISAIKACPLAAPDGVFLAARMVHGSQESDEEDPQIKLLVFSLKDDTSPKLGPVTHEMDLPQGVNSPLSFTPLLLYFDGEHGSMIGLSVTPTVIDVRTYSLYTFPPSHSSSDNPRGPRVLLSGTYIISVRKSQSLGTFVRVYVVPNLPPTGASRVNFASLTKSLPTPKRSPS